MGIITSILSVAAGVTSVTAALLGSKAQKVDKLDKEFKEYEHEYEIQLVKHNERLLGGNRQNSAKLKKIKREYIEKRKKYDSERKKLLGKIKVKEEFIYCDSCMKKTSTRSKFCSCCGEKL